MKVSRNNILYRFVYENPLTKDWRRTPNLCPFMRRVVAAFVTNVIVVAVLAWFLSCFVMAPITWFIPEELWGPMWEIFFLLGTGVWTAALVIASVTLFFFVEERYEPLHKAADTVVNTKPAKLTYSWCKTLHDKTCPSIEFTE